MSPAQHLYWIKKGYNEEEAKQKSYLHNSNSLESCIKKWGEDIGTKKYNKIQESFKTRKDTIIQRMSKKYNCTLDEANILYNEQMRLKSPKTIEYWTNKGYTKEQALDMIKNKGQKESPRHINYWLKKCGNNYSIAKELHYDYQDNCSISAIMKKYNYTEQEAVDKQNLFIEKMLNTKINKGLINIYDKETYSKYYNNIRTLTEKTYRRYKHIIDPENKRGKDYHLDHKYSICQGFIENIEPNIIASIFNLEIISMYDNTSKGKKCSITKDKLLKNK